MPRKQKTITKLKKDLWKVFSLYIKLKHSEDGEWCSCYTCGNPIKIGTSSCHGGHFLSKAAYNIHYFNENNVRPQGSCCNTFKEGDPITFRENLIEEIGLEAVEEMEATRHTVVKRDRGWYLDKIEHYKQEVERLQEGS